jgi:hypothetical protein
MFAKVCSAAVNGIDAYPVTVKSPIVTKHPPLALHFCRNTIAKSPATWPTVAQPSQFRNVSLKWKPHN